MSELMQHYSRHHITPRCTIKVDTLKAYDSIHWGFVEIMLLALHFPQRFVSWVMACISSPSYSISYNGSLHGYFYGKKGLRQGDPISPLLFVIDMEYVSRILKWQIAQGQFQFHTRCSRLAISHLCFADDAMFFCHGSTTAVRWLKLGLERFSATSGLHLSAEKSVVFLAGMNEEQCGEICRVLGMQEGSFPIRYLGIPLQSHGVRCEELRVLVRKITGKIQGWSNHHISYAGRVCLIKSVLYSITQFWSQIFFIPKVVLAQVQSLCRSFLWSGEVHHRSAPIAWDALCHPIESGGLDFKELLSWNKAAMAKLLPIIAVQCDMSLWVKWLQA